MKDEDKSKEQLLSELAVLRQQIITLKTQVFSSMRLEEIICESEIHFADLLDTANDAIISIDEEQQIIIFNQGARQIFGYDPVEIIGKPLDLLIPDRFHTIHHTHIAAFANSPIISRKMGERQEILGRRKNGEGFLAEAAISKLELAGQKVFTVVLRDITERKLLEEILVKSEERHRAAAELTSDYAYAFKVDPDQILTPEWVTDSFSYVTGFTLSESEARGGWKNLIHPDDAATAQQRFHNLLSGQKSVDEFRIITASGQTRWLRDHARPVWDEEQARVVRIYGAAQDVTERKNAEEALHMVHETLEQQVEERTAELRQTNEKLKAEIIERKRMEEALQQATQRYRQLFEEAPVIYIITRNEHGTPIITDCNELFLKTLKYSRQEVLQQPFNNFCAPATQIELINGGYQRALSGQLSIEERGLVTCDGEVVETLVKAVPEIQANGQVTGTRAAFIDISERKKLQRRLEAVYQLGQELTLLRDETSILQRVLEIAVNALQFDVAFCGLIDDTTHELRYVQGFPESIDLVLPLASDQGISVAVARSGQPINVPDTQQDPRYVPLPGYPHNRSELCVPITVGKRVIGVLNIESAKPHCFTGADQQLLQTLADQVVIALENARLYAETQVWTKQLIALNNAGRAMASSLDLNIVLEQAITEIKMIFEVEGVSVLLKDPTGDKLTFVAAASPGAEKMIGVSVPLTDSIAGWVIWERESVLLANAHHDARFYKGIDTLTGLMTQSLLAIPLILKDQVIGVIEAINNKQGFFNQRDLEILEALGSWAVIGIENARLHAEMKRRTQQLLALHELDWVITASLHIDDVYHALARHTARLLPYDYMSIALVEADQIHLTFVAGKNSACLPIGTLLPRQTSFTGRVISVGQPLLRHNIPGDRRFAEDEQLVASGIQSGMVIPLRVKGEVFGTWNINSQQISAYTPDDLAIAGSMGDQLAIAIDNARLYQAERAQFQRLQQSQAQLVQAEKMAALGRLVASIAHEINNPIQAIQNALTLVEEELADYRRPEKINLYMGIAKNEFERIATIVRRMRDFYRPTQPTQLTIPDADYLDTFYIIPLEQLQPINLHFILDNVLQLAHKQLQHSGITVERNWADNLPLLRGSSDHLKQVFLNLVLNALDAMTPYGGGALHVRTRVDQTELLGGQPQAVVRLDFSDTGAGISPEALPRLFEPLFTTKEHGSGLGLFTSYKIIEAHHGQITVESQTGKGATFSILLPLE